MWDEMRKLQTEILGLKNLVGKNEKKKTHWKASATEYKLLRTE